MQRPLVSGLPLNWDSWLDKAGITNGTPYLLSPIFAYDVALNAYFHRVVLLESSWHSQNNTAADWGATSALYPRHHGEPLTSHSQGASEAMGCGFGRPLGLPGLSRLF